MNQYRLKDFMNDEVMSESVRESLLQSFMKKREGDVSLKASQMIAIELLQEGWKELEKYKDMSFSKKNKEQVGL